MQCSIIQPDINTPDLCVVEEGHACKRNRNKQMGVAVIPWTCMTKVPVLYLGWVTDNPDCGFSWLYSFHASKSPNISMITS